MDEMEWTECLNNWWWEKVERWEERRKEEGRKHERRGKTRMKLNTHTTVYLLERRVRKRGGDCSGVRPYLFLICSQRIATLPDPAVSIEGPKRQGRKGIRIHYQSISEYPIETRGISIQHVLSHQKRNNKAQSSIEGPCPQMGNKLP